MYCQGSFKSIFYRIQISYIIKKLFYKKNYFITFFINNQRSKVVLIDEATANIDVETEQIVQKTLSQVFDDCTVITIAHRVNTIMSCHKILVLNDGLVAEFDSP